ARVLVDGDAAGDRVAAQRETSGLLCGEDRQRHTLRIVLHDAARRRRTVGPLGRQLAEDALLDLRDRQWPVEAAVRDARDVRRAAVDAQELLDARVPRGEVVVRDGPGLTEAVTLRGLEVVGRDAQRVASPQVQLPAELPRAVPVERLALRRDVRVLAVAHEEVSRERAVRHAARLDALTAEHCTRAARELDLGRTPGLRRREVGLRVDGTTGLEQDRAQTALAQLLRGPAPGR